MILSFNKPPSSICLIRLSAIGDVCHIVPVILSIRKAWPKTRITWIIGKTEYGLMKGLEDVEFIIMDKSKGLKSYYDLNCQLKDRKFDLLLHMHATLRANLVSLLVRSKERIGFDKARSKDFHHFFCRNHIPAKDKQHVIDGFLEFPKAIGIKKMHPYWNMSLSSEDNNFAYSYIDPSCLNIIISPCTGYKAFNYRNWPIERYVQIIKFLSETYKPNILITGGATDLEYHSAKKMLELSGPGVKNLTGKTSLKQLLALIKASSLVICSDSGPAHMATTVGTKVIGLYATSNPFRTGPYNCQTIAINKYPEAIKRNFNKPVEEIRWGARVRDPQAMNLISVSDVRDRIREVIEN
ncbi:MAG: hypothetical protein CBC38_01445 [Gammaproteobacteria bacterium TMED78]|nr:MAG: hypothetical protein CBC38_01445 [Gammaproteobacteria bacterium TMED78]|tara:strand:- start:289 stop:1347 length:1059 start_codon:yes stop_codon:yes gene_type:complete